MYYALINKDNNKIENIIVWDGVQNLQLSNNIEMQICTEEHLGLWQQQINEIIDNQNNIFET